MENISVGNLFRKDSMLTIAAIFLPGILFLAILFWLTRINNMTFEIVSRDPVQTLNGQPYIGILSNIGIILWCATAAILIYSSKILTLQKGPAKETSFLFFGGLLTILLLADDLFLIHDVIFPEYLKIDEKLFYLIYGASVIALFAYYYKVMLKTDYILFILAFCSFGSSALTDIIDALGFDVSQLYLFEDGLKFLGIIAWFAYFTRTSYKYTRQQIIITKS
jgi:hypothetical protein